MTLHCVISFACSPDKYFPIGVQDISSNLAVILIRTATLLSWCASSLTQPIARHKKIADLKAIAGEYHDTIEKSYYASIPTSFALGFPQWKFYSVEKIPSFMLFQL